MLESFGCSPNYPPAVLMDMVRAVASGQTCEYYELDPMVFDDDNGWLKKTPTHTLILVCWWFVCTNCHHVERYCDCDGREDYPEVQMVDDLEFEGADQMFDDHGLFQWGDWG